MSHLRLSNAHSKKQRPSALHLQTHQLNVFPELLCKGCFYILIDIFAQFCELCTFFWDNDDNDDELMISVEVEQLD